MKIISQEDRISILNISPASQNFLSRYVTLGVKYTCAKCKVSLFYADCFMSYRENGRTVSQTDGHTRRSHKEFLWNT